MQIGKHPYHLLPIREQALKVFMLLLLINVLVIVVNTTITSPIRSCELYLGWPWAYYERFQVSGSGVPNHGTSPLNFVIDQSLYLLLSLLLLRYIDISITFKFRHKENVTPPND
jgi:hypothetical protein